MRRFRTHGASRLAAAAVLFTAATGAGLAVAPAASAAPRIQQCYYAGGTGFDSTEITVQDYEHCPPFTFPINVSIWQFSTSDTWVEVASGSGIATYHCRGTLHLHYETRAPGIGTQDFYDNCG